jgi:hypothetical protein
MESYRAQGMDAGTAEILEIEKDNPEVAGWGKCKFIISVSRTSWNKISDFLVLFHARFNCSGS